VAEGRVATHGGEKGLNGPFSPSLESSDQKSPLTRPSTNAPLGEATQGFGSHEPTPIARRNHLSRLCSLI